MAGAYKPFFAASLDYHAHRYGYALSTYLSSRLSILSSSRQDGSPSRFSSSSASPCSYPVIKSTDTTICEPRPSPLLRNGKQRTRTPAQLTQNQPKSAAQLNLLSRNATNRKRASSAKGATTDQIKAASARGRVTCIQ